MNSFARTTSERACLGSCKHYYMILRTQQAPNRLVQAEHHSVAPRRIYTHHLIYQVCFTSDRTNTFYFYIVTVFSGAHWVFSRALGCGARRGSACIPRGKFGSRAGSVAGAPGVQGGEIWQVITGFLSAELGPIKTMENPHFSRFAPML